MLNHIEINGSVLKASGIGKCIAIIACSNKAKNNLYNFATLNDCLLDEFYQDVTRGNAMMECSKKLIDKWTYQVCMVVYVRLLT